MNDQVRTMVALGVIAYGTCLGAWFMLVQPNVVQLHEVEAAIARDSHPVVMDETAVRRIADGAKRLRERIAEIEHGNKFGRDSSHLYGVMMALGKTHGVRVLALQPGAPEQRPFTPAGDASQGGNETVTITIRRVNMSIVGTYEQVAAFMRAVDDMPQFLRPASVALSPRMENDDDRLVHGNLAWDVLSFGIPKKLAAIEGANHAAP